MDESSISSRKATRCCQDTHGMLSLVPALQEVLVPKISDRLETTCHCMQSKFSPQASSAVHPRYKTWEPKIVSANGQDVHSTKKEAGGVMPCDAKRRQRHSKSSLSDSGPTRLSSSKSFVLSLVCKIASKTSCICQLRASVSELRFVAEQQLPDSLQGK